MTLRLLLAAEGPKPVGSGGGHHRAHTAVGAVEGTDGRLQAGPVVQVELGKYILRGERRGERAQAAARNAQRMLDVQLRPIARLMVVPIAPGLVESGAAGSRFWLNGRNQGCADRYRS